MRSASSSSSSSSSHRQSQPQPQPHSPPVYTTKSSISPSLFLHAVSPHFHTTPQYLSKTIAFTSHQSSSHQSSSSSPSSPSPSPSPPSPSSIPPITITHDPHAKRKGGNGRLLILGGSEMYSGAPAFVGLSALRVGVDMIQVFCEPTALNSIRSFSPNIMAVGALPSVKEYGKLHHQQQHDSTCDEIGPIQLPSSSSSSSSPSPSPSSSSSLSSHDDILPIKLRQKINTSFQQQIASPTHHQYLIDATTQLSRLLKIPTMHEIEKDIASSKSSSSSSKSSSPPPPHIAFSIGSGLGQSITALWAITNIIATMCILPTITQSPLARRYVHYPMILDAEALLCIPTLRDAIVCRPYISDDNENDGSDENDGGRMLSPSPPPPPPSYRPYKNIFLTPNLNELERLYSSFTSRRHKDDQSLSSSPLSPSHHHSHNHNQDHHHHHHHTLQPGTQWDIHGITKVVYLGTTLEPDDLPSKHAVHIARALGNVNILVKGETDIITDGWVIAYNCYQKGGLHRCGGLGDINAGVLSTFALWSQSQYQPHIVPMLDALPFHQSRMMCDYPNDDGNEHGNDDDNADGNGNGNGDGNDNDHHNNHPNNTNTNTSTNTNKDNRHNHHDNHHHTLQYALTPSIYAAITSSNLVKMASKMAYDTQFFSMSALDVIHHLPHVFQHDLNQQQSMQM